MNPKKVKCPICGENMVAESWGMKRKMYNVFGSSCCVPGDTYNYAHYVCDCGNKMDYKGRKDCWEKK